MDHIKLITFSPFIRATAAMRGTPRCSDDRPRAERAKLQRHVRPPFVWQHRVSSGILPGDGTAAVGSTCAYTSNQKKRLANGLADVPAIEWLFDLRVLPDELIDRSVRKHQKSLNSKR